MSTDAEIIRKELRTPRAAAIAGVVFSLLLGASRVAMISVATNPSDAAPPSSWFARQISMRSDGGTGTGFPAPASHQPRSARLAQSGRTNHLPGGGVELIETHGTGAIEPPMVDGWGREGLVVMLGDGDGNLFVAVADLDDTDVEVEPAQGGSLVTCDEFVARFEEHITFDAPPYPPMLTKSWHDARRDMLLRRTRDRAPGAACLIVRRETDPCGCSQAESHHIQPDRGRSDDTSLG